MISGKIKIPGDKSISHRAALFSALRKGTSHFSNFNLNNDCTATLQILQQMGINYDLDGPTLTIEGIKTNQWNKPDDYLNAQNSGTTARLISAILSSLPFKTTIIGDDSLSKRPMARIANPLGMMGADIESNNGNLPLTFNPVKRLNGITYKLPVSSAQVKSAVLLAGLFAEGETVVIEPEITRDHTERILGLETEFNNGVKQIKSSSNTEIPDISMEIPGDFSSAAFFISAALLKPQSILEISNVSLNPTRTGYLDVIKDMGASIDCIAEKEEPEPIGRLVARYSQLKNIEIPKNIVPNIIDEIPILSIVATQAEGQFILKNAKELRYKESDRIRTIVSNLANLGVLAEEFEDGFSLKGPQKIKGGQVVTKGDHRIAMAFSIARLLTNEKIHIDNPDCASVSFPEFYSILNSINK